MRACKLLNFAAKQELEKMGKIMKVLPGLRENSIYLPFSSMKQRWNNTQSY